MKNGYFIKRIMNAVCAFTMLFSYIGEPLFRSSASSGYDDTTSPPGGDTDYTDLDDHIEYCQKNIELYPNEDIKDNCITLNGIMPESATATAVDVTPDFEAASCFADEDSISSSEPSASVLAAYDITITSDEGEFQPNGNNPIFVEITDPSITPDSYTELWHIMDDGSYEKVYDFTVEDGKIQFYASGFSVYAVVQAPELYQVSPEYASEKSELVDDGSEKAFFLAYYKDNATRYFKNTLNNNSCLIETTNVTEAALWYFEESGDNYLLYTYVNDEKLYLHNKSGNLVELSNTGDVLNISEIDGKDAFYLKKATEGKWLQHSKSGGGIRYYTDANDAANSNIQVIYADSIVMPDDYYDLDDKSYGLVNYESGPYANALMSEPAAGSSLSVLKAYAKVDPVSHVNVNYVAEGSDISEWTFHNVSKDLYKISTEIDGVIKYLNVTSSGITLVNESDASEIRFTPGTGTHSGKFKLTVGNTAIAYTNNSFKTANQSSNNAWLSFAEKSDLNEEDFISYNAVKVGISDADNNTGEKIIHNGSQVIIYTREWDDDAKQYNFYAIDHDGSLVPVFERGDDIMWIGSQINTLLWDFIVYTDDNGTENNYYEFYNPYSEKYIAPQITGGQILSDSPIGVNLPGRRNGEYYTSILAWDEPAYYYAGVKADNVVSNSVIPCNKNKADTFYFAMTDVNDYTAALTTASTVDNNNYGISMKMIDYSKNSNNNNNEQYAVLADNGDTRGLLTSDLKNNGYPDATKGSQKSLFELYENATEVNHLFLQSTYEESGYFEFDSCQNFATLIQEDGTVGTDFIVYNQLGTSDKSTSTTLKHGQFFPYNTISTDRPSTLNPKNLYSALAIRNNENAGALPETDPRKYETLYGIPDPNYYNGMELSASFNQTPSGKDNWGHDMIFEFTGDDDFWLYVDGELIIDLGGIHSALAGSVNFATGTVIENGRVRTLRQVFTDNYMARNPDATTAQLNAFLAEYFEEGEDIFKDYSSHTMKIFYMERGAGASNLHMRFNLSSVRPGHVTLSKQVDGIDDDDFDFDLVEYPFQIYYWTEEPLTEENRKPLFNTKTNVSGDGNIFVSYVNSNDIPECVDGYSPPNCSAVYDNVFFLTPGKSLSISFPSDMIYYQIVECAVNSEVYDTVSANGAALTGHLASGSRFDYTLSPASVDSRQSVVFQNHVDPEKLRTLTIQKNLYASDGVTTIENDPTGFNYRLFLSIEGSSDVTPAVMYKYYVKDNNHNLCRWDVEHQEFVPTTYQDFNDIPSDTEEGIELRESVSFHTSINGAISKIPSWYTVEVPNLPVGTRFMVVEREEEIPLGYRLIRYERDAGSYNISDGDTLNSGTIRKDESPKMFICNKRGWELEAKKIWSDADFVSSHEDIYFAVYINGTLKSDSVRRIKSPDTTVTYYYDGLEEGADFSDYEIREVKLTGDITVNENGEVTSYSTITPVEQNATINIMATSGSILPEEFTYHASYAKGTPSGGNNNARIDTVTNTPEGSVTVRLYDWGSKEHPLANGVFELSLNNQVIDTYTSDENGEVVIIYNPSETGTYTLTQIKSPSGYAGMPETLSFEVNGASVTLEDPNTSGWVDHDTSDPDGTYIGVINIHNKPFTLLAVKYDSSDPEHMLPGAVFELYRSVTGKNGEIKDYIPMSWGTSGSELITDADGVIPNINSSLRPGTYYLTEKNAPDGYSGMSSDLVFNISATGVVTIVSGDSNCILTQNDCNFVLGVPNVPEESTVLTITKTVEGTLGNKDKEFTFTLTVEDAGPEKAFTWTKNGIVQSVPLYSGDTFTLGDSDSAAITLDKDSVVSITEANEGYVTEMKLDDGAPSNTNSITITLNTNRTLAVVNTMNGTLPTGIGNTLMLSVMLFIIPIAGIVIILKKKRSAAE